MIKIEKNKHIYAAYANLAQHNYFTTMRHIVKSLNLGDTGEDEKATKRVCDRLDRTKKGGKDSLTVNRLCKLLLRHFPFIAPMEDALKDENGNYKRRDITNQQDAYFFIIDRLSKILKFYRNYTTHFNSDEDAEIEKTNRNERDIVRCLMSVYKTSIRVVQQRFGYTEFDVRHFKNRDMGKSNFKYCLYKKELISASDDKPSDVLSLRGLILLLSLFLEKKYISEMLAKTNAFYQYDDMRDARRKKIIFETLAVYRIKTPRVRYEASSEATTALALDMLNELQRCPRELFDLLDVKEQELFRAKSSNSEFDDMLLIRHNDRFAHLALKYIDTIQIFKAIRFQVALGNYRFAFYDKKCIDASIDNDSEQRVRILQKPLHGFGRLDEIENERREKWATMIRPFEETEIDTSASEPYITDRKASYLINNNRIGLYWKGSREDPSPGLPDLPKEPKATDLRQRKQAGEKLISLTTPKCFMSTHELPAMVFYSLLFNRLKKTDIEKLKLQSAEQMIKGAYNNYRKFVSGILDGTINGANARAEAEDLGINFDKELPKKLVEYLSGKTHDSERDKRRLAERLEELIERTKSKLARHERDMDSLGDKRNRRGRRDFVEIKPGSLGSWLAKDIVALQPTPSEGNNKLTSLNFGVLQSSLSVYRDLDTVRRVLVSARLINSNDEHPFLMEVVNKSPQNVVEFYRFYLESRLEWLQSLRGSDLTDYRFIARGVNKWHNRDEDYYKRLAQSYADLPVELPRGLFANPVKTILSHLRGAQFVKGSKRDEANVAFLITKYLKECMHDDSQDFYTQPKGQYKRHYRFFNLLRGDKSLGMTIAEIEDYMRSDSSLNMLSTASEDVVIPEKIINDLRLKLAKAKAKNPNLDITKRVLEIMNSSPTYKTLPATAGQQLVRMITGNDGGGNDEVKRNLAGFRGEEKKAQELRLTRSLHDMKSTERLIRRYRVQDIIIFLMARDILLGSASKDFNIKFEMLKLKNIKPIGVENTVSPLEIKVPFSIILKIDGRTVIIRQKELKLKNYGDFYLFLHDSRLKSLIPYLTDDKLEDVKVVLDREELEQEFKNYDRERLSVFENVHRLEQLILLKHRELLDKTSPDYYYIEKSENKEVQKEVRNNFRQMLNRMNDIDEKEREELIVIRNAFSHNSYGKKEAGVSPIKIGSVAEQLSEKINNGVEQIHKKKK